MSQFKCFKICKTFGFYARVLPSVVNFTGIEEFEGEAMPVITRDGRQELNALLKTSSKDRVVLIDASHHGRSAIFGRQEAESARAGGARAVIVLGSVAHVAALRTERLPVLGLGHTPRMVAAESGTAEIRTIDIECGLITPDHYIVGDADGVVAVERELYQQRGSIK